MSHLFIGGSARCGKSSLAREVGCSTNAYSLSGDAFRTSLRKTSSALTLPALHAPRAEKIQDEEAFIEHHTEGAMLEIEAKRAQAATVWPFIQNYANAVEHES